MITKNLLLTRNWKERSEAERLGIDVPEPEQIKTKMLFWKKDVKRATIDENMIILTFNDDECYAIEYDDKLWKELETYFRNNEDD